MQGPSDVHDTPRRPSGATPGSVFGIVPTFNERGHIARLIETLLAVDAQIDVLIVDDASPDGTGVLADEIAASEPRVSVLHRAKKGGLGSACLAGFRRALEGSCRLVFHMDGDLSHKPSDLARMLSTLDRTGADVCLGSRRIPGSFTNRDRTRRIISAVGSTYAGALLGLPIRDLTSGFKCFRRRVVEEIVREPIRCSGYGFMVEVTYRAYRKGFRVVEVPISYEERTSGVSKLGARDLIEAVREIPRLRWEMAGKKS